jgi:membrane protease YdiL (CAAX protease family)
METAALGAPSTEDRLRWSDLLPVVVFAVLGVVLIVALLIGTARADRSFYRANLETLSLLATLGVYLAVAAGIAIGLRRLRSPISYLRLRWPTARDLGISALLLVPWYVGFVLVSALSALLFNGGRAVPSNSRLVFIQRPNGVGLLLLALLVTAVAAPICEEIVFRGMLFRLLRRRTPLWAAVLLSALTFGLAHASPAVSLALLPSFVYMGIVLALVYIRTGWLTNSMLLHGFNNALVTIAAFNLAIR